MVNSGEVMGVMMLIVSGSHELSLFRSLELLSFRGAASRQLHHVSRRGIGIVRTLRVLTRTHFLDT